MQPDTIHDCDGCSACCESIGCPPFLLEMDSGVPSPIGGDDSLADQQRLLAAPAEARSTYLHSQGAINCPCAWLDKAEGRCRYYEFRPDICRTFEVGGKWCLQHRQLHQIG